MVSNKVMVAGHICLDITPKFPEGIAGGFSDIFSPGKLINVEEAVMSTGGAVSNTGLTMSKLGLDVVLNGKVGKDEFGQVIMNLVGGEMASSFSVVEDQNSSYSIVLALPGIDRVFLHHPGTNDTFTSKDIDYSTLQECDLFHFGYPPLMKQMYCDGGVELIKMFKRVKDLGVITSLDMTLPDPDSESGKVVWKDILEELLQYVDVFVPSVEEVAFMLDRPMFDKHKAEADGNDPVLYYTTADCEKLAEMLIGMGVKIVAIKCGINGYYLQSSDKSSLSILDSKIDIEKWALRQLWAPSYKASKIASATGAGDATIAGFLASLVKGLDPIKAVKIANTLGWQNVRKVDALSGIEDWDSTIKMVEDKTRETNSLSIKEDGWDFCEQDLIFKGPKDSGI